MLVKSTKLYKYIPQAGMCRDGEWSITTPPQLFIARKWSQRFLCFLQVGGKVQKTWEILENKPQDTEETLQRENRLPNLPSSLECSHTALKANQFNVAKERVTATHFCSCISSVLHHSRQRRRMPNIPVLQKNWSPLNLPTLSHIYIPLQTPASLVPLPSPLYLP